MHHAYLLEGPLSIFKNVVESAKKLFGFKDPKIGANPDVHTYIYEKFNIEEARELVSEARVKTVSGRALFLIAASSITTDAQQALLKLFEEPQEGVIFVLLTAPGMLIPTLRSRLTPYPEVIEAESREKKAAAAFLKASGKERSSQITILLKDDENIKERVREFLSALEESLFAAHAKKATKELRDGLEEISLVRKYIPDRSASLKMLLEHLAIALPTL